MAKSKSCQGLALIELALVLPAILALFLGGMEVTRTLRASQVLGALSKQAANRVFRECIDGTVVSDPCVQTVAQELNDYADASLPGAEVVLSVYDYDGAIATRPSYHRHTTPGTSPSRYSTSNIVSKVPGIMNPLTRTIAISEVFYRNPSAIPVSFLINLSPEEMYETTIY